MKALQTALLTLIAVVIGVLGWIVLAAVWRLLVQELP